MSFIFHCPHCNQKFDCDDTFDGQEVECPSCEKIIKIRKPQEEKHPPKQDYKEILYISAGVVAAVLVTVFIFVVVNPILERKRAERELAKEKEILRLQEDARKTLKRMDATASRFNEFVELTRKCAKSPDKAGVYLENYRIKQQLMNKKSF